MLKTKQVKSDINKQLKDRKHQLDRLGSSRETKEQQHKYLLALAARFQHVTSLALNAQYGADILFDKYPVLKLATMVVNRNEIFSRDVSKRGHTIKFSSEMDSDSDSDLEDFEHEDSSYKGEEDGAQDSESDSTPEEESSEDEENEIQEHVVGSPATELDSRTPLLLSTADPQTSNRYTDDHDELDDLLQPAGKVALPKSTNIIRWLQKWYNGSRGFELGTFDASIVPIIWKKQSINWEGPYLRALKHFYGATLIQELKH